MKGDLKMLLLYFGIASFIAVVIVIIYIMTADYTKDPKTGEDKKEDINDYLLPK